MLLSRALAIAVLIPALSACQLLKPAPSAPTDTRMQGSISQKEDQWHLQPCDSSQSYTLKLSSAASSSFENLSKDTGGSLFADLAGQITAANTFAVNQLYRLQTEGHGCTDPDFSRLQLRASGNEPFWSILQTPKGLILNQAGEPALALPYIEEQLPDGRFQISTQADQQNLQLWVTPQQCIDSMSGTVYHLSARLQLNQQTFQGCAAFGALRN